MSTDLKTPQTSNPTSEAEREEAMEVAEDARETTWTHPSFAAQLFAGSFRADLLFPFPDQSPEDRKIGDEFLERLEAVLREKVDPETVDQTGELPPEALDALIELGCFGMKIPKEYGGLGLSQTNYNRACQLIASHCGSTAVWVSAHQSIGVPQPLKMFGTEEQKKRFLPRLAKGAISAFALTEVGVGSDPARMETFAEPTPDGKHYILNGEKLWCTNGVVADLIVVMARTPSIVVKGRERQQITALIVEKDMPGFEVVHRCQFMGIRAIQNGLLRFRDVKVPVENVIWGPGKGLKLALMTLNTGRLTVPAATTGGVKQCLKIARNWSNERRQWGAPIGKHDAVAEKLAYIASHTFAMDAITWFTSGLADRGDADIRLEAAMAKLFCTEVNWKITDETLQIRGGRGFETATSLGERGEDPIPVERMFRDTRINRIIEGTSEIMRLFIAREALDFHMQIAGPLLKKFNLGAALKAAGKYMAWLPRQFFYLCLPPRHDEVAGELGKQLRFIERTAHKLARNTFYAMGRYQQKLEKRQQLLGRFVDIGVELFAMAASVAYARSLQKSRPEEDSPVKLAEHFCRLSRRRIQDAFRATTSNDDRANYLLAQEVLASEHLWMEEGVVAPDCLVEKEGQREHA